MAELGFRFASLGSGSRGNATIVQAGESALIVDNGFAVKEVIKRCEDLDFDPASIDAILVTHEHGDHMRGVGALSRRFNLPVWMTHGTWHAADFGRIDDLRLFNPHQNTFEIGEINVTPVPVPHDAREPSQFVFSCNDTRFGLLTDLGSTTPHLKQCYQELDALFLECNHDVEMLGNGPYPPSLQARVGGNYGHLNNQQAAEILATVNPARLKHVVAAHLSEKNNHPDLAREVLCAVSDCIADKLTILQQDQTSGWFSIVT